MNPQDPKYQLKSKAMSSAEPNYFVHFAMRHPVKLFRLSHPPYASKWSVPSISRDDLELGYHVEFDNLEDPGNEMPSKIKPFRCSACDAAFNMKCFLNMHVRKVHGNDKDAQYQQMS